MKRFSILRNLLMVGAAVAGLGLWSCKKIEVEKPVVVTQLPAPTGVEVGVVTAEEAAFSWNSVEGAYSYTAELKLSSYGSVIKAAVVDAAVRSIAFAGLEPGTEYFFHVRANDRTNEAKNSYFTEFVNFTTQTIDPQYTPLATPQNVICDALAITETTLTFRWDVVENAGSYTYKISWTDAASQPQERAGVVTGGSTTSTKVEGLDPGTTYRFQVRANPEEGSTVYRSGNYSVAATGTTVNLAPVQLATPGGIAVSDASSSGFTISWGAVTNASGYDYQFDATENASAAIVANSTTSKVFGSLAAATTYKFRVRATSTGINYTTSEWSAWTNAATNAAASNNITVSTAAELKQALIDIPDGGTIIINAGTYSMVDATNIAASLVINKAVTLQGASTTNRPYINAKDINVTAAITSLTIKNIEYSAFNAVAADGTIDVTENTNGYVVKIDASAVVGTITIENCFIHNVDNAIVRANQGTVPGVNNLVINNNLMYNIDGKNGGICDAAKAGGVDVTSWTVTNNTVTNLGMESGGGRRLFNFPTSLAGFTANISHNTFYNFASNASNFIDATSNTVNNGNYTITYNIFYHAWLNGTVPADFIQPSKGMRLGTGTLDLTNNAWYYTTGTFSAGNQDFTTPITADPAFGTTYNDGAGPSIKTPLTATFIPTQLDILTGRIGDPRWLPSLPSPTKRK